MSDSILLESGIKGEKTRRWMERQIKRNFASMTRFTDAFFGENPLHYLWSRLRFYFSNQTYFFLLHIAEFFLVSRVLTGRPIVLYIVIAHLTSLVPAAYWGLLEGQRTQLNQTSSTSARNRIINEWYVFSWQLFFGTSLIYLVYSFAALTDVPGPVSLFLVALGLRNIFDVISRSRYSAIFATNRVYRPVTTIVILETAGVAANIALYLIFGNFITVFFGIIFFSILNAGVSWHFTSRAYKALRISAPRFNLKQMMALQWPAGIWELNALNHMFYMLMQRASSVFIVLILYHSSDGALPLVFHLISPLIMSSTNWVQLFYFDFRKFRFSEFQIGLRRYTRTLLLVAITIGASSSALAIFSLYFFVSWQVRILFVPLAVFLCFRSIANTTLFLKFDQYAFRLSLTYFVISVLIPAVYFFFIELDDVEILIALSLSQFACFFISISIGEKFLLVESPRRIMTSSVFEYNDHIKKMAHTGVLLTGVIDFYLTSAHKFFARMTANTALSGGFVDFRSGRFFITSDSAISCSAMAAILHGDALSLTKCDRNVWDDFFKKFTNKIIAHKNSGLSLELYSGRIDATIENGWVRLRPHVTTPPYKDAGLFDNRQESIKFSPFEVYLATKRSLARGRQAKLPSSDKLLFYIDCARDNKGFVSSIRLIIEPREDFKSTS